MDALPVVRPARRVVAVPTERRERARDHDVVAPNPVNGAGKRVDHCSVELRRHRFSVHELGREEMVDVRLVPNLEVTYARERPRAVVARCQREPEVTQGCRTNSRQIPHPSPRRGRLQVDHRSEAVPHRQPDLGIDAIPAVTRITMVPGGEPGRPRRPRREPRSANRRTYGRTWRPCDADWRTRLRYPPPRTKRGRGRR